MENGMIFDIAHSSFVDGPGIRTTVFFKGCNLRCLWCHNPEGQSHGPQMLIYSDKCTHCNLCESVCPTPSESCRLCGVCTNYCPASARMLCGELMSVDEIMGEIEKDTAFYSASDGGVTFSGGECMLQADFLLSLLRRCREMGIHTAIDTAGCVPRESLCKVIPFTDTFLYDMKCFTEELHLKWTGVSNKLILDNLAYLSRVFCGDIIVRIPLICGFNTETEELMRMARFLREVRCSAVEFLPYHRLGEHKYAALGLEPNSYSSPSSEEVAHIEGLFKKIMSPTEA